MIFAIVRTLFVLAAALVGLALVGGRLGWLSGRPPLDLGVKDGKLKAPSKTDNSVSSQARAWPGDTAQAAYIDPIAIAASDHDGSATLRRIEAAVAAIPGTQVVSSKPDYVYAQSTTKLLRYVDDMEFWLDAPARVIHVRSASRLGRKDFGVNRARVEAIRRAVQSGASTDVQPSR
jgi:uncharacterized protein (DUF1499 family)